MYTATDPHALPLAPRALARGCAVTIGNFDGVHLGHQSLIRRTIEKARAEALPVVLITFEPHPLRVLFGAGAPPQLMSLQHKLEWVEDCTNQTAAYLRNRLRQKIAKSSVNTSALMNLRAQQIQLKREISRETERLLTSFGGSRYFFGQLENSLAIELLASDIARQTNRPRPTRPRTERALLAVRTARSGGKFDVGDGIILTFTTRAYRAKVL